MENWSKLKADEKIRVIKFARLNGVSDINTIRDTYNLYSSGGDLGAYNTFVETLPDNMKPSDTTTEINNNTTLAQLAVDYIHSYYNSEGFKARRKQYNWQRGEPRRIRRRMDRITIPINYVQGGSDKSLYDYHRNEINVGSNPEPSMAGLKQYTIPVAETAAHEVTHAYDYPKTNIYGESIAYDDSYKERGYYSSLPSELYNKYFTNLPRWTNGYRRRTDELYADLGGLRAMIYLATGYDSRLVDDKGNPIPISDELWNAFKQTDYYKNNRFIKTHGDERSRSALLEIAQNNLSSSFLRLDGTYLAALGGPLAYKKSTGGPLYPFSFEKNPFLKTPVVRYDEGGFFARLLGKKDTPPTPEEIKADRVERFINDTWETEYSVPRGYDSITGLFYPYKSPEGGTKTIGPGFKLRADGSGDATMFTAKEAARGVTREQINEKLRAQGELLYDKVLEFLNQKGNRLPVDTINPNIMNGLMDLRFLVGTLGGWNNLREAVLNGDLEGIKKESLVTFKDSNTGKIKPDARRNELRAEKFWHYD